MNIKKRLYDDFFRPSKENEYEKILKSAYSNGYEFHTVLSFEDIIRDGVNPDKRYIILRRDIDTADFKILLKMLALEKQYGAKATYYFRWNTYNVKLMKEIEEAGGEASYHYEEMATYCYKHRIRSKVEMLEHIEEIRDMFITQLAKFRKISGQKCLTVASHGDYVNSKLNIPNKELIDDRVRISCCILREAYDAEHMDLITCRIADQVEGDNFTTKAIESIERGEPVLELLTHPRQWNSPFWVNLKEEINRVCKYLYMGL